MPPGIGYPPNQGADRNMALQEAFRRRASLGPPSTAGMTGGAPVANRQATGNLLATMGQAPVQGNVPKPPPNMSQPGMDQMKKSAPGESELIIKALSARVNPTIP